MKTKKLAMIHFHCVACGTCIKICPMQALSIKKGCQAVVNETKCIGCGKCVAVCPGGLITLTERNHRNEEKTLV